MNEVYVLVPLAQIHSQLNLEREVENLLHLNHKNFQLEQISKQRREFYVRINEFQLSFLEMSQIVKEKVEMEEKIKIIEQTLLQFEISQPTIINESLNFDELVKKAKKAKQLKEENKKLKKLLQIQLQNTEKVRQQTQKTMRNLKEQFDALVTEMTLKQNKNEERERVAEHHHHKNKQLGPNKQLGHSKGASHNRR